MTRTVMKHGRVSEGGTDEMKIRADDSTWERLRIQQIHAETERLIRRRRIYGFIFFSTLCVVLWRTVFLSQSNPPTTQEAQHDNR